MVDLGARLSAQNAFAAIALDDRASRFGVKLPNGSCIANLSHGEGHLRAEGICNEHILDPTVAVDPSAVADGVSPLTANVRAEETPRRQLPRHGFLAIQAVDIQSVRCGFLTARGEHSELTNSRHAGWLTHHRLVLWRIPRRVNIRNSPKQQATVGSYIGAAWPLMARSAKMT